MSAWLSDRSQPFPEDVLGHAQEYGLASGGDSSTLRDRFIEHLEKLASGEREPSTMLGRLFVRMVGGEQDVAPRVEEVIVAGTGDAGPNASTNSETEVTQASAPETGQAASSDSRASMTDVFRRMANGTDTREDRIAFEQGSEAIIREGMTSGDISGMEGNAALRVISADGNIGNNAVSTGIPFMSMSESQVYQKAIEKAVDKYGLDLGQVLQAAGVSRLEDIDNSRELGMAMVSLSQQREQSTETGRA